MMTVVAGIAAVAIVAGTAVMPTEASAQRGHAGGHHGGAFHSGGGFHPGGEIAPEVTGHGLPLSKCEAYNRVYEQHYRSS